MRKSLPHRLLSKLIRFPFGGGSSRVHHLRMARLCALISSLSLFYGCHNYTDLPLIVSMLLSFVALIGGWFQEVWAGSDRDEEERRQPANLHWLAYGKRIKHRSWVSHGFIVGTFTRMAWGYGGLPFFMIYVGWGGTGEWIGVALAGGAWVWGALVNDLGHLILDI